MTIKRSSWSIPYLIFLLIFVVLPLVLIAIYAFQDGEGGFTFANIARFFTDEDSLSTFALSLEVAIENTAICLLLGYPAAHIMADREFRLGPTLVILFVVPMWMNFLLRTIALMSLMEDGGLINTALEWVGIGRQKLLNNTVAVQVGMIYNFLPFMILPLYSVMSKINVRLLEASSDLGANGLTTIRRVVFPLSVPGIITGVIQVFIPAASTFVISQRLGDGTMLVGDLIENFFIGAYTNFGIGSAMSLVLMLLMLVFIGVLNRFDNDDVGDMLI